jgi:hypothetical protein
MSLYATYTASTSPGIELETLLQLQCQEDYDANVCAKPPEMMTAETCVLADVCRKRVNWAEAWPDYLLLQFQRPRWGAWGCEGSAGFKGEGLRY